MPSSDILPNTQGSPRRDGFEITALCIGNALGSCGPGAMPLWVADLTRAQVLSVSQVGPLASGELFAMALSVVAVSAWGKSASPRSVSVVAASVAVVSNLLSMLPSVQALVIGRLLSGLAMGALLASATKIAACRRDAQRVLTLMQALGILLMSAIYFVSPALFGRFGSAGLFATFSIVGSVMIVAALVGLPRATDTPPVTYLAGSRVLSPLLACLALAIVYAGHNSIWTYIVSIGATLGFDARTVGTVLAVAPPLALLGPLAAHLIGERAGLLRPILVSLGLLAINIWFLVDATSQILFCIYTAALHVWMLFCMPYAIALLGRLDSTGRFASSAPAFMMGGGAAGPALGARIISADRGFHALALVAALTVMAGIVLFSLATRMHAGRDLRTI